jgi:hypothetical protein
VTSLSNLLRRRREDSKNPFGTIEQIAGVYSPELDNKRDLLVSLPGGYSARNRQYPVIYMHDGQNLFDPATSFSGSWNVDVAMAEVSLDGLNAIGLRTFEPRGAFYAFPEITSATGLSSEAFARGLLEEERVAVIPGSAFGPSGEGHVRACYATSYEDLEEALGRIGRFVDQHRAGGQA